MYKITRTLILREVLNGQKFIRTVSINSTVADKLQDQVKPWNEIPGPFSLPIIGQLLHFLPGGWLYQRTIDLQNLLYNAYGPIVRLTGSLGLPPITFIFHPEVALNLFRKEDTGLPVRPGFDSITYHRRKFYNKNEDDPVGLILENGENWKKIRTIVNPVMLHSKTIKLYTDIMTQVSEDMVTRIKLIRNQKNMIENDFFTELSSWSLESVAVVALGKRLNGFDPNLSENSPEKKLINSVNGFFVSTERLDFQPSLWKYFATPEYKKAMKIYDDHIKLNEYFIEKAEEQLKSNRRTNETDKSILEKLLEIDRTVALLMTNDMLLAGVDTAASSMLGILYLLAMNPDKQNILREEVMSKQEKRPYLKACIKESLRLYPVVGGNFRQTTREHDVLGYRIPKNMCVIVGNQHLCLMEEQFPRAKEFLPERWIVDKNDPLYYGKAHPFVYSPFGFGVRSCIGRRIAELELETFIVKLVESFQIEWLGTEPKRTRKGAINYFVGPYNFIFKDV